MEKIEFIFAANMKKHEKELADSLKLYDLACLNYNMQEQQFRDCTTEALKQDTYLAAEDCPDFGVKVGDRILDEQCDFLLSERDFPRLCVAINKITTARGLTREDGYILNNALPIMGAARRDLLKLIASIIPPEVTEGVNIMRASVVNQDKLIDIFRKSFKKAPQKDENKPVSASL